MRLKTALSIAGSDSSGGAGIQADLKTMTCNGVFAMSAITALTAQNTTGVTGIYEVTPDFLGQQIDAVFTDIYPDAVKIGMVSSAPLIHVIAQRLADYDAPNIVVDPVMVATSGAKLLADDAIETLCTELLPLATVATPNLAEAEILSGQSIESEADMRSPPRPSAGATTAPCSARAGIKSAGPTTCSGPPRASAGTAASASTTPIPTGQAVPSPVPSPRIWRRGWP